MSVTGKANHSYGDAHRTGEIMHIQEAKAYVNEQVELTWVDRKGEEIRDVVQVYEVNFVPLYGPCMITNVGEIRLDRIKACAFADAARMAS